MGGMAGWGRSDLQPQQIVHGADDDVDGGRVACLGAQVVLEIFRGAAGQGRDRDTTPVRGSQESPALTPNPPPLGLGPLLPAPSPAPPIPLLCPSQRSCRKRKRSCVNSSSDITFSPAARAGGRETGLAQAGPAAHGQGWQEGGGAHAKGGGRAREHMPRAAGGGINASTLQQAGAAPPTRSAGHASR